MSAVEQIPSSRELLPRGTICLNTTSYSHAKIFRNVLVYLGIENLEMFRGDVGGR